ncbi:MAG: IS66 family transposase [Hyphomicrobiaceae bacterium]|nr:MAG: IS66 family transposase [Hyphomicrobiaceae bacterium]
MVTDSNDLPDDVAALQALIVAERAERRAEHAANAAAIVARATELAAKQIEIDHLRAMLAKLRRQRYGRSSEKLDAELDQLELTLEDAEAEQAQAEANHAGVAQCTGQGKQQTSQRPRQPAVRKPLPDHLPREIVVLEPNFTCRCNDPSCRTKIREEVTEVLEKIPSQLKVIRYIRPIYACRACEMVSQAPAPDLPILKGRPGPNLITHIAIAKYYDGMPLYRQSKVFGREGVEIERMVMADWMGHFAWWISPLVEMIGAYVMSAPAIHADDTPIKVLSPGKGRTATGRLWIYAVDERPWAGERAPAAFYRYSPDRKGERPKEHLAGFSGFLHADAYAGYALPGITHVQCMAHARRYFFDVFDATKSPVAKEALERIGALYAIEADINGKPADVRLAERQTRAVPLLTDLKGWLEGERRRLSLKSSLGKALQYSLSRWQALTRYASDGRLAIDNGVAERGLRTIAVSRKNFLFLGSDEGGVRAAHIYTIVESARMNGLNPQAYLADVIDRLAKGWPRSRLAELLPWNWSATKAIEAAATGPPTN